MDDEAGGDAKILAVPIEKLTKFYNNVSTFRDVQQEMLDKISHFFEHYKDLEQGKWVKVEGWAGKEEARQEIIDSAERYQQSIK
jgi:inorganic pyrophosphatase